MDVDNNSLYLYCLFFTGIRLQCNNVRLYIISLWMIKGQKCMEDARLLDSLSLSSLPWRTSGVGHLVFSRLWQRLCQWWVRVTLHITNVDYCHSHLLGMRLWEVAGVRVSLWDFPRNFFCASDFSFAAFSIFSWNKGRKTFKETLIFICILFQNFTLTFM